MFDSPLTKAITERRLAVRYRPDNFEIEAYLPVKLYWYLCAIDMP
jgi:hypothetical protein